MTDILRTRRAFLVQSLDLEHSVLLEKLVEKDLITPDNLNLIRVSRLLIHLMWVCLFSLNLKDGHSQFVVAIFLFLFPLFIFVSLPFCTFSCLYPSVHFSRGVQSWSWTWACSDILS